MKLETSIQKKKKKNSTRCTRSVDELQTTNCTESPVDTRDIAFIEFFTME